ncbi:MAG: glycosyltransferase family 1 protein [Deltaproteobacteria bacterium]|nr:glycosyltransferase family 1 protein [Deltaproteobacteria bacterium]
MMRTPPRILLIRSSDPYNTGVYYSRAFKQLDVPFSEVLFDPAHFSVMQMAQEVSLKNPYHFVLVCDSGKLPEIDFLVEEKCPKGFISIDSCHKFKMHQEFIKKYKFDYVWVAQKQVVKDIGKNTLWLPLAADEEIHCYYPSLVSSSGSSVFARVAQAIRGNLKCYDIGMCAAPYPHRKSFEKLFKKNKLTTNFHYRKKFASLTSQELSKCTLGFNSGAGFRGNFGKDINMRVFETMANGMCALLTNTDEGLGYEDLFEEGKHFIGYRSCEEALEKAKHFVKNPLQAMRIAREGQRLVLDGHLYVHRVEKILEVLK